MLDLRFLAGRVALWGSLFLTSSGVAGVGWASFILYWHRRPENVNDLPFSVW